MSAYQYQNIWVEQLFKESYNKRQKGWDTELIF